MPFKNFLRGRALSSKIVRRGCIPADIFAAELPLLSFSVRSSAPLHPALPATASVFWRLRSSARGGHIMLKLKCVCACTLFVCLSGLSWELSRAARIMMSRQYCFAVKSTLVLLRSVPQRQMRGHPVLDNPFCRQGLQKVGSKQDHKGIVSNHLGADQPQASGSGRC